MKNLNKEFSKYENRNLKHNLKKDYVKALEDKTFKSLIVNLNVPEEVAMNYTSDLLRAAEELDNCSKCNNLYECNNPVPGFYYSPRYEKDKLLFDYKACKHTIDKEAEENDNTTFLNMPRELKKAKIENIYRDDAKRRDIILWISKFFKEYKNDRNIKGLYLHGSFGSGKTYILTALLNELSSLNISVVAAYYPEILRSLKESFETGSFNEKMETLKKADILFLDDIGAESVTSWNRDEILGTILQYRMDSKLPTFFTSNLTLKELENHFAFSSYRSEKVKARRIIERILYLTDELSLISENRRK